MRLFITFVLIAVAGFLAGRGSAISGTYTPYPATPYTAEKPAVPGTIAEPALEVPNPDPDTISVELKIYEITQFFESVSNPFEEYNRLSKAIRQVGEDDARFGTKVFVEGDGVELYRYWNYHKLESTPGFTPEGWANVKENFRLVALAFQRGTAVDIDRVKLEKIYKFSKFNTVSVYRMIAYKLGVPPRRAAEI